MKKLLILACLLAMPCFSWAQSNKVAWESLNVLQPGQRIQVIDKSRGKHSGTFLSADALGIKLHEKSGDVAIQRESVQRITVPAHRARHALIGLAVGAGAGAAIGAASYKTAKPCPSGSGLGCVSGNLLSKGEVTGLGAVLGAVSGAIVGVLLPAHKIIYQAP